MPPGPSGCRGSDSQLSALSLTRLQPGFSKMDARKLALLCRHLADQKKADDIVILDVRALSSVTDYFVIASGTSEPHLRAIVDEIRDKLRDDHHLRPKAVDGTLQAAWVVLSMSLFMSCAPICESATTWKHSGAMRRG